MLPCTSRSVSLLQMLLTLALAGCLSFTSPDCPDIDEFYRAPGLAGECGKALAVEGSTVCLSGLIDWNNVLENEHKFTLNGARYTIEIYIQATDSREIFREILKRKGGTTKVTVRGTCNGFDMPVMGRCVRGVKVVVASGADLQFHQ